MRIKNNKSTTIILISFITFSILSLYTPLKYLTNFAHDDSFFYLKIAQNIVNGAGITFDNISITNGFHPLYLIIISGLFLVLKTFGLNSSEHLYKSIFIFHILLNHVIVFIVYNLFKRILSKQFIILGITIFIAFCISFVFIRDYGIESHISCILLSLYILINNKQIKPKYKLFYSSLLISCIFLCRTDYLFSLIPSLILSGYLLNEYKDRYRSLAYNITGLFIIVFLYYSINLIYWGNIQTTSSIIINTFPINVFTENFYSLLNLNLYNQGARFILFNIICIVLIFKRQKNEIDLNLTIISLGLVLYCILHLFYNSQSLREWYMTLPMQISGIAIVVIIEKYSKMIKYIFLLCLIIVFISVFYLSRISSLKWEYAIEYASFIKENTEKDDLIYQYDMSGIISFFSNRHIIDGDGLVNSYEYLSYLKGNSIEAYMRKYNVKYLSTLNYSENLFNEEGIYKYRLEESLLSPIVLKNNNLYHLHKLIYSHGTGNKYGYFLLFKLSL